jgi:cytosine/adenosine deaminase-related metal-dependent hydrolase
MRSWTFVAAIILSVAKPPLAAQTTALVGGTLIDGFGGPPIRNSVVVVEGERIAAVGRIGEITIPDEAEVISTEGMTVLPGLWDMHVHLMIVGHSDYAHWDSTYPAVFESVIMPAAALQLLRAGVTSARDLGAPLEASIAVRDAINAGRIPGPTMYMSGPFVQHEPYPGTELFRWGVSGERDAREKIRRLAEAGVDVIKLIDQDQMTMEEVRAVVDEAHLHGLPVVAHSHRPEDIRRGLAAGIDTVERPGVQAARAAKRDEGEICRVVAALHGDDAERAGHGVVAAGVEDDQAHRPLRPLAQLVEDRVQRHAVGADVGSE